MAASALGLAQNLVFIAAGIVEHLAAIDFGLEHGGEGIFQLAAAECSAQRIAQ